MNKRMNNSILALISGMLFCAAWPEIGGIWPLLGIAFVPLLMMEKQVAESNVTGKRIKVFLYSYLAFFLFNLGTTWWIYYASPFGMAGAVILNAMFMAIVFTLFHIAKSKVGARYGYISFICFWMAFEYLHLSWQLSWPWLTLGNGLANSVKVIQWYEFTGVLGGSLWILGVNVFFFRFFEKITPGASTMHLFRTSLRGNLLIFLPLIVSVILYYTYDEEGQKEINVAVVQPNIDPYREKFNVRPEEQLEKMLSLSSRALSDTMDFLVFPETAIPQGIVENTIDDHPAVLRLREFLSRYPQLQLVTGINSYRLYKEGEVLPPSARVSAATGNYFDAYNTALQVSNSQPLQLYHKSKLVLGVETTPYPEVFGFFEKFAIDLGGITGTLGTDPEPRVFTSGNGKIAPVICYESVYGGYVSGYIRRGAEAIFVITNDGWWDDTPGYKQHLSLSRIRAIENRRSIARSANTGISCFINQRGDVMQPTPWWKEAVITGKVSLNQSMTLFARTGDYLGIAAAVATVLLSLWAFLSARKRAGEF